MVEVIIQSPGVIGEAALAYLGENNILAAVRSGFAGEHEDIVFYLDEIKWEEFRLALHRKLHEISEIFKSPIPKLAENSLKQEVWQNAWKRYARTYRFGKDLIVKPTWRKLRTSLACPVISIDPQMAFGTGGHASTRLCIHHLIRIRKEAPECLDEVLDVGTGSGILAIAAARMGAGRVVALDIDFNAIQTAERNALHNGVADVIEFRKGVLDEAPGEYGLIMANVDEEVLSGLLGEFARHLRHSGRLVVSGILSEHEDAFVKKTGQFGLRKISQRHSREWVSYCFRKKI